ncbi:signal peptide protein [Aggregatibacter actinomycetemcomitans serotype d str. SA3033]|nr:DUF4123 domain-containing protein [Aggregatibacter actinomycetemcomitans]AFI87159.2 signal peptide protein [Aggregatibacter actinomycetemcomitans D7S-1]KOE31502.1 signal peptide protein [Aggregatibacter actinomycetemcomitans D17P-3]KOE64482.1 signal peptide protein [Aggregatibacter actinomycetemcomitans serotype d str. I63B]KYK84327.1 signal peptide protein [Aggregatibacter actinomycetemcomitans serotype d str. SA3033]
MSILRKITFGFTCKNIKSACIIPLLPLPLETYFQRHGDETFIKPLKTLAQDLSENNPLIIFNPNQYQENEKSTTACLTKTEFLLRREDERTPFLLQPIPDAIKPYLWAGDSQSQCYAIINAEVSFWFPTRFEVDDIRYACLFKGKKGEIRKKTAPYLLQLPENHPFVEELCSESPRGKEGEDGFQQWNKNFGYFFRSCAPFDELLHHFRKFIYMKTYDGHLLYFRFYNPIVLEQYFDRLMYYPKKLATFWGTGLIDSFILPKGENVLCYTPNVDFSQVTPAKRRFDKFEMKDFIEQKNKEHFVKLVDDILETSPFLLDKYTRKDIETIVTYHHDISKKYNIRQSITIGFFTLVTLLYGKTIDALDSGGIINSLLQSSYLTELNKIYYIQQRLEFLEGKGVIHDLFEGPHGNK